MFNTALRNLIRFFLDDEESTSTTNKPNSTQLVLASEVPSVYTAANLTNMRYVPEQNNAYCVITRADVENPDAPAKVIHQTGKASPSSPLSLAGGIEAFKSFCIESDRSIRVVLSDDWLGIKPTKDWVDSMMTLKFPDGSRIFNNQAQIVEYSKYLKKMAYDMPIFHIINDPSSPVSTQQAALQMLKIGPTTAALHADEYGFVIPMISEVGFSSFTSTLVPNKTNVKSSAKKIKYYTDRLKSLYQTVLSTQLINHEFSHAEEVILLKFCAEIQKKKQNNSVSKNITIDELRSTRLDVLKEAIKKNASGLINAKTDSEVANEVGKLKGLTISEETQKSKEYIDAVIMYSRVLYNLNLIGKDHILYPVATANKSLLAQNAVKSNSKSAASKPADARIGSMILSAQKLDTFPDYISQVLGLGDGQSVAAAPQEVEHLLVALKLMQQQAAARNRDPYAGLDDADVIMGEFDAWGPTEIGTQIDKPRVQVIFDLIGKQQVAGIVKSFAALDMKGPTTA